MPKVYLTPNSAKLLKKIKGEKTKRKIKTALGKLAENPQAGKKLRGELEDQYSLRVWPYRIIYLITKEKDIIVTDIGHRKDIYR